MTCLNNKEWLGHLENSVPPTVSGDRLSIYAIALEGWRRGLKVNFYDVKYREKSVIRYSVTDGSKEVKFAYSTGPGVTSEAKKIAASKTKTKKYLEDAGVPVPKGERFIRKTNNQIIEYAVNNLKFPVVLKPTSGKMGRGVIANIRNKEELQDALVYVRERLGFNNVILEEFIPGEEYRIYVLDGKVIAGLNRLPANVIGDGVNTIKKLIKIKNAEREQIPSVRGRPIKIDSEVKRNVKNYGYTMDSVPPEGERLLLRKNSNISSGGDPVDATDILDDKVKDVAVMAAKAVSGLVECGVDLIVDERDGVGRVIELNTSVGLAGHLFPVEGKSRDIPNALIDYYFPDTKRLTKDLYFDFTKVTHLLKTGNVHEVTLPVLPKGKLVKKSFIVKGKVKKVGFLSFVRRRAMYCNLNGFTEAQNDDSVFIVVAGTKRNIDKFQEMLNKNLPIRAKIDEIIEGSWDSIIEAGFEVNQTSKKEGVDSKKKQPKEFSSNQYLQSLEVVNKELEKKVLELQKENRKYLESTSWKMTAGLRKIKKILK